MTLTRRRTLAALAGLAASSTLGGRVSAQSYGQAVAIRNDEGRAVANAILPGEITGQLPGLRGLTFTGPREADTVLYEFFDFNCPYCRKAAADLASLGTSDAELRIGLVHNPILSAQSAQAAKVMLAVQRRLGSAAAHGLYGTLLGRPGRIDGPAALEAAAGLGVPATEIEAIADGEEVRLALKSQMKIAADLGHPGARTLAKMVASTRRCDRLAC